MGGIRKRSKLLNDVHDSVQEQWVDRVHVTNSSQHQKSYRYPNSTELQQQTAYFEFAI
jgi:hypothetical protein